MYEMSDDVFEVLKDLLTEDLNNFLDLHQTSEKAPKSSASVDESLKRKNSLATN